MRSSDITITFIGAGNMATSIIGGLLGRGHDPKRVRASDPNPVALKRLEKAHGIHCHTNNSEAIAGADVVVLAVKPQVMGQATADIRAAVAGAGAMVISIAAGITVANLEKSLGKETPIVRCMPNTPALLGAGVTALYANRAVTGGNKERALDILSAVGAVHWLDQEEQLDAVTALSGSGPAYFFLFMEAMANCGEDMGLDPKLSRSLTLHTGLGASLMAAEGNIDLTALRQATDPDGTPGEPPPGAAPNGVSLVELRRRVTSPGGTTERALQVFEDAKLRDIVARAMGAAAARAREMAREAQ